MMKGRASLKSVIVIVILLLVGVLGVLGMNTVKTFMGSAAADTEPKNVLAKPGEDGKSASITWSSDKPTVGVVEYGTTPASLLLRSLEADQTTDHRVNLTPLKPGTNYYFRIRIGEEVYDNNGIPYSFKTKAAGGTAEPGGASITPKPGLSPVVTKPATVVTGKPASPGGQPKCTPGVDYNKDGVANNIDFIQCMKGLVSVTPVTTITSAKPTVTALPASGSATECRKDADYDGNSVVNTLDWIKCLQTKR